MQKISALLMTIVLAAIMLASCVSSSDTREATTGAPETEAAQETAAEKEADAQAASVYTPGTYTASSGGMDGPVSVTITVDENSITDVVIEGNETPGIGSNAIEQMPALILEAQSADIDAVSNATVTSNAILTALSDCLAQAEGRSEADTEEERIYTADVLVLGGGGAGLAAALSAADEGASVIVLEASSTTGGDTARASHIAVITDTLLGNYPRNDEDLYVYLEMNEEDFPEEYRDILATLKEQINEYLETTDERKFDTYERIMIDHYIEGSGTDLDGEEAVLDFDLIEAALTHVNDTYAWVVEKTDQPEPTEYYDGRRVRPAGKGEGLTSSLRDAAVERGALIYLNTRAKSLVTDESGRVIGAVAKEPDGSEATYYGTGGVIIATGGFQSNAAMATEYQNLWTGTTEATGSTGPDTEQGDGILMAQEVDAALVDMQFVTTIVWGYHGSTLSDENRVIYNNHQILVNKNAERFCDDKASTATAGTQPDGLFYVVGNGDYYDYLGENAEDFAARGILFMGDTIEEAAEAAGLDPAALKATVEKYNSYVEAGEDPEFGKTEFNGKIEEGPFVLVRMETAYHLTLGGIVTDTEARVLRDDGSVIEGLYAAGDVTGGIEGSVHQSADNLSSVIYYGMTAGANAAADAG